MRKEGGEGQNVEDFGCRMGNREPLKVIEQRSKASEAALYIGQWKMVWRDRRWKTS